MRGAWALAGIALGALACGGSAADAKYPKRPDGCEVTLYQEIPEAKTDNIGSVRASCAEEVAAEDCIRTLKDQVCRLGGDVVWGVGEPEKRDGKVQYSGRAAHTVGPKKSRSP